MASVTYLLGEFRDRRSVAAAIKSLREAGVTDSDLDIFSEEPVEFPRGVLDRPSRMSVISVLGAIALGGGGTWFVWWAQNNYAVITGGIPVYSWWGTGVITYELTMLGAVLATFGYFLWESGLIRKRDKSAPIPVVAPECICLRVRSSGADVASPTALLQAAGATSVEKKAAL
jgi:hypothetical protein